ncbi:MAG: ROK family protein [Acidobacteriia bacterium]|nr:ROK family protein [Terriglobia bacterium]
MNNVLAIDIGGTNSRVGLFDEQGRRLMITESETRRDGGREWMQEHLVKQCGDLLAKSDYPVKACGISFGGPVDFQRQTVTSVHVPGWKDFALAEWGQNAFHLPCQVENDANAGALGEGQFGAGRGTNSLFYFTLSTGIGGGYVADGRIVRGRDGVAGEVGHIPVSDSGAPCSCGARGCLEVFCSGTAIAERGREWGRRRPEGVARMIELSAGQVEEITAKTVALAAAEGDPTAVTIMKEVGRWLARGVLTIVRIVNPDRVVLGGGVSQAGVVLLNPVREALQEFESPTIKYSTEIVLAELGTLSPLYGAAAVALKLSGN